MEKKEKACEKKGDLYRLSGEGIDGRNPYAVGKFIGSILTYTHTRPCEGHPYTPFNNFEIVTDEDVGDHFDATSRGRGNPLLSFGGQNVSDSDTPQMQINMRNSYGKNL